MNESNNHGAAPAAFPSDYMVEGHRYINEGVTFRDYFAAAALQGLMANPAVFERYGYSQHKEDEARLAYEMADAMLRERDITLERSDAGSTYPFPHDPTRKP